MIDHILILFNIVSFTAYGIQLFVRTESMHAEFTRYGLSKYRVTDGILQLTAAIGLTIGYVWPLLVVLASGGLALQMLAGIVVRRWIRDSWFQCLSSNILLHIKYLLSLFVIYIGKQKRKCLRAHSW